MKKILTCLQKKKMLRWDCSEQIKIRGEPNTSFKKKLDYYTSAIVNSYIEF